MTIGVKYFFYLLLLSTIQLSQSVSGSPKIACANYLHDFGVKNNSEVVKHQFTLHNDGDSLLILTKVRYCCGLNVNLNTREILPRRSATVDIELPLKRVKGKLNRYIFIATNDPVTPYLKLRLKGESRQIYNISSHVVCWRNLNKYDLVSKELDFCWKETGKYSLKKIEVSESWLSAMITNNDEKSKLRIKTIPLSMQEKNKAELKLHTDHPLCPIITITVVAQLEPDIKVAPSKIVVHRNVKKTKRFLTVSSKSKNKFNIRVTQKPKAVVHVYEIKRICDSMWFLSVDIDTTTSQDGAVIEFETDITDLPRITIPIEFI